MKVLFIPKVREYAKDLIHILYEKDYFGFEEAARQYVDELIFDIRRSLPAKLHKKAPVYFDQYGKGMKYAVFRKNRNTSWYVFFTQYDQRGEIIYLVRFIANNHTVAQYL